MKKENITETIQSTIAQRQRFLALAAEGKITAESLHKFLENPSKFFEAANKHAGAIFTARVRYTQPATEDLLATFDYVEIKTANHAVIFEPMDICKSIIRRHRHIERHNFEYVCLGRDVTVREALVEIDLMGFRPAFYEELLGFARQYPDEQRKFLIVALGSFTSQDYDRYCACLYGGRYYRSLGMVRYIWDGCSEDSWDSDERFLVTHK